MSNAAMSSRETRQEKPVADRYPEEAGFWSAAAEGRFMVRACNCCGKVHWYPRPICPICFSADTEWRESNGTGEVYTFSIMRKSATGAYAIGYVDLDEGCRILTNFVDCDFDALRIGQRVKVTFRHERDKAIPYFTPFVEPGR